ncbi:MAG TPA: hypothetical protein VFT05_11190, partial [Burkholderiaceae bacterium]|nr:hypothetical protein [Burkholderiaceae bacterium]
MLAEPPAAAGPLEQALGALGYPVLRCADADAASALAGGEFALVALDADDATADLAGRIAALRQGHLIPLIVCAGAGADAAAQAYAAGAVDVLHPPLLMAALRAKVDFFLQLH